MANNSSFQPELQELQASITTVPQELYPKFDIPVTRFPTPEEKVQVKYFKEVQSSINNESPFYIQLREKVPGTFGDGIERYSDKWKPKRKVAQSLTDLRTDERYFPDELLVVLQGDVAGRKKRKQQTFDLSKFLDMNVELDDELLEASSAAGDNVADDEQDSDDEDAEEAEDATYSEDGNDYEENYFSGGENDFEDGGADEEAY